MAQPKKAVQRQRSREKEVVDFASKLNIRSQKQVKLREKEKSMKWEFPLKKNNMYVLAIGLGIIILGYLLMASGITEEPAVPDGKWNNFFAVVVAPILLVFGYLVVIPYGLLKIFSSKKTENPSINE